MINVMSLERYDEFRELVGKQIKKIIIDRNNRPKPKDGYRYVKNGIDTLIEKRRLNTDYFMDNINDIWNKVSDISSNERRIISYVCNLALIEYLQNHPQEPKTDQP